MAEPQPTLERALEALHQAHLARWNGNEKRLGFYLERADRALDEVYRFHRDRSRAFSAAITAIQGALRSQEPAAYTIDELDALYRTIGQVYENPNLSAEASWNIGDHLEDVGFDIFRIFSDSPDSTP